MAARYGSEIYSVDHKGRVSVPVALRRASTRRSMELYLTLGFEGCIAMYDVDQWKVFEAQLRAIPYGDPQGRAFVRAFLDATFGPLTPDAQGRITIPQKLLDIAGLKKDVKFLPLPDRIEIWDPARYDERQPAPVPVDFSDAGKTFLGGPRS